MLVSVWTGLGATGSTTGGEGATTAGGGGACWASATIDSKVSTRMAGSGVVLVAVVVGLRAAVLSRASLSRVSLGSLTSLLEVATGFTDAFFVVAATGSESTLLGVGEVVTERDDGVSTGALACLSRAASLAAALERTGAGAGWVGATARVVAPLVELAAAEAFALRLAVEGEG